MQQIPCSRCGYTLAGMPGSMIACPNCGQQTVIPGGSSQGWNAYPGAQPTYGAPQPSNPYGTPPPEQQGYGNAPSYGQPAAPYPPQQAPYGPSSGAYGAYGAPQPGGYPGGYAPPATMPPPAPARRNPILPIALVVVLLLVAGGAFFFIKNNNKSGGGTPSGYTQYTDTAGHYAVSYPSNWTKRAQTQSDVSEVLFEGSSQADVFAVAEIPGSGLTTNDLAPVLSGFFTGFAGSLPGGGGTVANQSSPQNVTIGGDTWTQESGDINYTNTSGSSATAHSEVAAVVHNNLVFLIAYATQDASKFNAAKQQYFTPMINSFAFK